jgi:uncharacterized membrane protein YebE (DUF533 family)
MTGVGEIATTSYSQQQQQQQSQAAALNDPEGTSAFSPHRNHHTLTSLLNNNILQR